MSLVLRMQPLEQIRFIDPDNHMEVSATVHTDAEYLPRYGWVRQHTPDYGSLLQLSGNSYSAIAAYSVQGIPTWYICKGTTAAAEAAHFLDGKVQSIACPLSMVMIVK